MYIRKLPLTHFQVKCLYSLPLPGSHSLWVSFQILFAPPALQLCSPCQCAAPVPRRVWCTVLTHPTWAHPPLVQFKVSMVPLAALSPFILIRITFPIISSSCLSDNLYQFLHSDWNCYFLTSSTQQEASTISLSFLNNPEFHLQWRFRELVTPVLILTRHLPTSLRVYAWSCDVYTHNHWFLLSSS